MVFEVLQLELKVFQFLVFRILLSNIFLILKLVSKLIPTKSTNNISEFYYKTEPFSSEGSCKLSTMSFLVDFLDSGFLSQES